MARKRVKKRTQKKPELESGASRARDPKSMVIRIGAGEVGPSVSQLVTDVRRVMEPSTASRLKERRANRLRDYVTMCGPLGVTHLLLFSRSTSGNTNMRLCLAPKGPTMHFRVEKYSLAKDVQRAQRHPRGGGKEFATPPLLVMNNFTSTPESNAKTPRHLETLATTVFQSLFPPINPQTTPLKSIRRVLLLNREPTAENGSFVVNFRHYAILTKVTGISKALKRLSAAEKLFAAKKGRKGGMPNLGKLNDIADFMIGGEDGEGYITDVTSGSEVDTDAEVEVLEDVPKRVSLRARAAGGSGNPVENVAENGELGAADERVERRAIKLVELGPRMQLRLTKVEEDICSGRVMWHEYIHKTKEETRELEQRWERRRQEKEARKKQQRDNVAKKRADKNKNDGGGAEDEGAGDDDNAMMVDSDEFSDFGNGGLDDEWDDEDME